MAPQGGDGTASQVFDLDAAAAARLGVEGRTRTVRIGGRTVEVVSIVPFVAIEEVMSKGDDADVREFANRICPDPDDAEHVGNVLGPVHLLALLEMWGTDPEGSGVQSPPSAATGTPSTRTSNGSTRSTSRKRSTDRTTSE